MGPSSSPGVIPEHPAPASRSCQDSYESRAAPWVGWGGPCSSCKILRLSPREVHQRGENSPRVAGSYRWDDHLKWRGYSLDTPPRGTHAPLLIIFGTPRSEHLKGDYAELV